jgi:CIC family chloride channel protein
VRLNLRHDLLKRLPKRVETILLTSIYGLAAGLAAVAFQRVVNLLFETVFVRASTESLGMFAGVSLVVIVGTSSIAGWLLARFCREAAGSGIPQVKVAFWKDFGFISWRAVWVKFVAGVLSIGGGSSLGREGPSVHLAGGVASNLAGWLGEPKQHRRLAAASGAAAGLAAAFNTPLAAITFVLEEIVQDLNSRILGSILLASVIGAFVVHGLVGRQPAFELNPFGVSAWWVYLLTPLVAVAAAFVGVLFQNQTLSLRRRQKQWQRVPDWARPALGGFITWLLALGVFYATGRFGLFGNEARLGVFSLGYEDLSAALRHGVVWQAAALLLAAKFIATVACYGLGGCGGIFSPTLFFGGMTGVVLAGLAGMPLDLQPGDHMVLAVVGMSACLSAVVRAPVTGILIVFEMTHEFALVPALMIGALASQMIARRFTRQNFYEQVLVDDGHDLERVIPPRDLHDWQQLPVSAIANFAPVLATDTGSDALKALLKAHPYSRFPVFTEGRLAGVLTRAEAERCAQNSLPPQLGPALTCQPHQTIRHLQHLLIESSTFMVVLVDQTGGRVLGLVTLHDLLRAETRVSQRIGEEL